MRATTLRSWNLRALILTTLAFAILGAASRTQAAIWSATNLHPAGASSSQAHAIRNGQQVGAAEYSGSVDGALWTGTAASFVNMGGFSIYGTDGVEQVGPGPLIWFGTPGSATNIAPVPPPPGYFDASLEGVHAGVEAGWVLLLTTGFVAHAGLWTGSGVSFVDLNPAVAVGSQAFGTHNGQQAGVIGLPSGAAHAGVWYNTAASFVDIHPAGATASQANDVYNGRQAGMATIGGAAHAGLWTNTAASFVDLHPLGATASEALSIYNTTQVGYSVIGGFDHAGIWNSTAGSWEDISPFLPPGYYNSRGAGVWINGSGTTFVAGWATNISSGVPEAMLWTTVAIPEPANLSVVVLVAIGLMRNRRRAGR